VENTVPPSQRPHRVRIVGTFDELISVRFTGDINALCWPRQLPGDFQNILDQLPVEGGITTIDEDDLNALTLSPAAAAARDVLLADQTLLREHGFAPTLDCIAGYPRDVAPGTFPTDVYSFHVDSAPIEADTYLCTYIGSPSEGLSNEQAIRRVDDAQARARLLQAYGGPDDAGFAAHLHEKFHDLHYAPLPQAAPYSFGTGNLWRIANLHPGSPVLPCIHRAPLTPPGSPARLLLIS
jgi:hypothetical protein